MFKKKLFANYTFITIIWFSMAAIAVFLKFFRFDYNNYKIFKGVFWHTIDKLPLYEPYPAEYNDVNHYGVFFSAIIAPFAILPDFLGVFLWVLANGMFLYIVIRKLPVGFREIMIILFIVLHDMYGASEMQQFNISIAAILTGAFLLIEKKKEEWATLLIVIGFLTKIYGIIGLAFFFFAKNKVRFVWTGLLWLGLGFVLPMLYSSPEYVITQYQSWWQNLIDKNNENLASLFQNISILGFLRTTGLNNGSDKLIILSALFLFMLPYLRFAQYQYQAFRFQFLASVCLFVVLFSTGSEASSYVIASLGTGIWFVFSPNPYKWWKIALLTLAIIASISGTDIVPRYIKYTYIVPYSLRAIPAFLIWITLILEMCFLDYRAINEKKILSQATYKSIGAIHNK